MDLRRAGTRIGTFRIWVLVFLILFVALCGVHLFVLHHDGDSHSFEFALAFSIALVLAVATGASPVSPPPHPAGRLAASGTLKVPRAATPGFVMPLRT
jgi:lysylphosphatidylglycerol synthetase-like protein (DUF2156 family)